MKTRQLGIVGLSFALVCACDRGHSTAPARDPNEPVATVTISALNSRLRVGGTVQFSATVRSANNRVMAGQSVQWTSSDSTIASINDHGYTRGEKMGSTTITARVGDRFATRYVFVYPGACTRASVSKTIGIGETRAGDVQLETGCFLNGEPITSIGAEGWRVNLTAPAQLQFDLTSNMLDLHLVITDTLLRTIAASDATPWRRQLDAGSYFVWIVSNYDGGAYELALTSVPNGN
jgi:hypothetical protein